MRLKITFDGRVAGQRVKPSVPLAIKDQSVRIELPGKKPVEIPARVLAESFIGLIDKGDAEPGDGQADFKVSIPLGFLPKEWAATGILSVELVD